MFTHASVKQRKTKGNRIVQLGKEAVGGGEQSEKGGDSRRAFDSVAEGTKATP